MDDEKKRANSLAYLKPNRERAQEIKKMNDNYDFQYRSMMECIPNDPERLKHYLIMLWLNVEQIEDKVEKLEKGDRA